MAALRFWRRRNIHPHFPTPRPRRTWNPLRLEQLEDRTLMAQNAVAAPLADGLYQVLLGRKPQGGEDAGWIAALQNGTLTPGQEAIGVLNSPEYRSHLVERSYETLLGRAPEATGMKSWVAAMNAGGDGVLLPGILSSDEYYALHGKDSASWLAGLYSDVLGRAPDSAGQAAWIKSLQGGATRADVAAGIVNSEEAHTLLAKDAYHALLARDGEAAGVAAWARALDAGMTPAQLIAGFVDSPELFHNAASGLFPPAATSSGNSAPPTALGPFASGNGSQIPTGGSGNSHGDFTPGTNLPDNTPPGQDTSCGCSGNSTHQLPQEASGLYSAASAGNAYSASGVRYFDGAIKVASTQLSSAGFGTSLGQTLGWTNAFVTPGTQGRGMMVSQQPYLVKNGTSGIVVVLSTTEAYYFDLVGAIYVGEWDIQDTLTFSTANNLFTFTDTQGNVIQFFGFNGMGMGTYPAAQQGTFSKFTDPASQVTQASDNASGQLTQTARTAPYNPNPLLQDPGQTITEWYAYTYISSGVNAGLVSNATLWRQVSGQSAYKVRQVAYTYYDGTQSYGNADDLITAIIEDPNAASLGEYYYRYYVSGDPNGYVHGLKYLFSPQSYARLIAAVGTPTSATDSQVAPYADDYYQYDSGQRVTEAIVQNQGCSSCSGGLGTFAYAYTTSTNPNGLNSWAYKTVETLPDGNQNIIYANYAGETMLKVYHDVASGNNWEWFAKFDSAGRVSWQASPSALTGYDDSYADLLHSVAGNYAYMSDNNGLVTVTDYYLATTATTSTPGGVTGYYQDTKLQQGELGTAILQNSTQYIAHTSSGITIYPVANTTRYRNTDGTGGETTSYSYTWFNANPPMNPGNNRVQSMTTSLPVVTSTENGPGTADVSVTYFDTRARPIWTKNADGFINYRQYDDVTSAVVRGITDVDTTKTTDFSNLPSGWTTPAGGGLHLKTQYVVDNLGRTTQVKDPNGNLTYTVFNDPNHDVRIYPGWQTGTNTTTGPTQDYRTDYPGSYLETLTTADAPHVTNGLPDGTESITTANLQTLSRHYISAGGQVVRQDAYFSFAGMTYSSAQYIGTQNSNYYTTLYGYDDRGRRERVQLPTGTINRTVSDGLGRVVSTWVGTNDTPGSGEWSPSNNTSPSNMIQVTGNVYDGGGVGDSNVTQVTQFPGGSAANRVTNNYFDWRDRLVASKQGVQGTEDTTTHRPIIYNALDNLGETTTRQHFDGDGVTITISNGVPQPPPSSLLREQTNLSYDDQMRVYLSQVYDVNQTTGALSSSALTTNTWRNHRGLVIKVSNPGGLVSKYQFDGAARQTESYTSDGGGDSTWTDAGNVTGDNVLSQIDTLYDSDGNVLMVTDRERFHNETATGALGNPTTAPKARVSYVAYFYDARNRLTATANVGTNGGATYTYPGSAPIPSDTVLVTSDSYNAAGWVQDVTDPRGIMNRTYYDALHHTTQTIQDYTNGTPTSNTNKTTNYTYDGDGNLLTLTAVQPGGLYQKTGYIYGVTTGSGSTINSNDILAATQYPDPTTGNPSPSQQETYTVNGLGQTVTKTDRNGNVHTFSFDVLGRQTADAVTTLGSGVDGSVLRIETAYDTDDRPYLFTSYNAASGGSIVNQVEDVYNGLSQLITQYQANSGAVNINTTPKVQYAYNEMSNGENNSRLVSMTYPNGRVLNYNYSSGLDDTLSRLSSISDSSATLEAYTYLGLSTVVDRSHPQPGVDLTYIKQTGESNGDAGDQYTGLDRFGRVVDQRWLVTATGTATDRFQYAYDRDGNPLSRNNLVNTSFGELYESSGTGAGYDQLNQLTNFERGVLSASVQGGPLDTIANPTHAQSWTYDALGNWSSFVNDGSNQTRTANQQNEITSISGQTTPGYDSNGNTTADQTGKTLVYDAWNRLVAYKSGNTVLVSYTYDPLGRRITENSGTLRNIYFSAAWQVLEEDVGGNMQDQHVWSPVYIDAMIERDTPSQRLYVQQDANWDVTAVLDASGNLQERYIYDPYGQETILAPNWSARGSSSFAWVYSHEGGRYDSITGLYDFRNREYSPILGRWIQLDPVGFQPGDSDLYRYVGDNPRNHDDPTGEDWSPAVKLCVAWTANPFWGPIWVICKADSWNNTFDVDHSGDCGTECGKPAGTNLTYKECCQTCCQKAYGPEGPKNTKEADCESACVLKASHPKGQ